MSGSHDDLFGERDDIVETLVVSFPVVLVAEVGKGPSKRCLTEKDHLREAFGLCAAYPALRLGVHKKGLFCREG